MSEQRYISVFAGHLVLRVASNCGFLLFSTLIVESLSITQLFICSSGVVVEGSANERTFRNIFYGQRIQHTVK